MCKHLPGFQRSRSWTLKCKALKQRLRCLLCTFCYLRLYPQGETLAEPRPEVCRSRISLHKRANTGIFKSALKMRADVDTTHTKMPVLINQVAGLFVVHLCASCLPCTPWESCVVGCGHRGNRGQSRLRPWMQRCSPGWKDKRVILSSRMKQTAYRRPVATCECFLFATGHCHPSNRGSAAKIGERATCRRASCTEK